MALLLALCAVHSGREPWGNAVVARLAWWHGELLPDGGRGQGQRLLRPLVAERALEPHPRLAVVRPKTSREQWWGARERERARRVARGGVDTHAWGRGVLARTPSEGGEHLRGQGDLDALRELADETLRGLASSPSDHLHHVSAEGRVRVPDLGHRRMMISVTMSVATALPRTCWRTVTIFGRCRNCWATRMSARR